MSKPFKPGDFVYATDSGGYVRIVCEDPPESGVWLIEHSSGERFRKGERMLEPMPGTSKTNTTQHTEFDSFQDQAWERSNLHGDTNKGLLYLAAGLSTEANEVLAIVNKNVHHNKPYDRKKLIEELGDTLWYLAMCARKEGVSLSEVAKAQIEKNRLRFPNGYTREHYLARMDEGTSGFSNAIDEQSR